ncbi:MAG: N-acetylmuramoyl-L-alanine amidase [Micropruina sp.]|uniref:N-acetylmuramoyl-L-alanine amidase n=1 Tax=Micropruina sp. TaxID=2737536 RepID=UPI0039E39FAD
MGALGVYRGAPVQRTGVGLWNKDLTTIQAACVHDTEGGYEGAIGWMEAQKNGSYHRLRALLGQGAQLVPETKQAWSAMTTGNRIALHACLEGYARWTRAEWLAKGRDGLEGLAHDLADWHRRYGIPLIRIGPADLRAGRRGICTHADISAAFGESDHTDPGSGFPLDLVISRAKEIVAATQGDTMALTPEQDIKAQLTGSPEAGKYPGWKQLGDRTLVDAVAAIGAQLGIPGFVDPKASK